MCLVNMKRDDIPTLAFPSFGGSWAAGLCSVSSIGDESGISTRLAAWTWAKLGTTVGGGPISTKIWPVGSSWAELGVSEGSVEINESEIAKMKVHWVRTSLVVQWLRICLLMQGTRVRALVREGKIPHAAEQLRWCATTTEARAPTAHALQQEKPPQWEARSPQWRVAPAHSM